MPIMHTIKRVPGDGAPIMLYTTSSIFPTFFRNTIIALAAITLVGGGIWFIQRTRAQLREDASSEYVILESEVSIEFGDEGVEIEYDEDGPQGRHSFETILGGEAPQRIALEIEKLRAVRVNRRQPGSLLERRGKRTLILRPSEDIDADMAILDMKDGKLTVSPFSSRKEPSRALAELPTRRRTPRYADPEDDMEPGTSSTVGPATAPHQLQSNWRPVDSPVPGYGS